MSLSVYCEIYYKLMGTSKGDNSPAVTTVSIIITSCLLFHRSRVRWIRNQLPYLKRRWHNSTAATASADADVECFCQLSSIQCWWTYNVWHIYNASSKPVNSTTPDSLFVSCSKCYSTASMDIALLLNIITWQVKIRGFVALNCLLILIPWMNF